MIILNRSNNYEGDNKMGSLQLGLENQIGHQKKLYFIITILMTENMIKRNYR